MTNIIITYALNVLTGFFVVKNAVKDSLIILCSDVVPDALVLVKKLKEHETKGELISNN